MLLKKENMDEGHEGKENYHQVLDLSLNIHVSLYPCVQHVEEAIAYFHKMLSCILL